MIEFKFLDIMGEEINPGDTVVVASLAYGRSPRLFLGLIQDIKIGRSQVRAYYKKIGEHSERDTYICLPHNWSGKPSSEVMKISGVEFSLNQNRFAKLFAAKADFESSRSENKNE